MEKTTEQRGKNMEEREKNTEERFRRRGRRRGADGRTEAGRKTPGRQLAVCHHQIVRIIHVECFAEVKTCRPSL